MQAKFPYWRSLHKKPMFEYKALMQFCRAELKYKNEFEAADEEAKTTKKSYLSPETDALEERIAERLHKVTEAFMADWKKEKDQPRDTEQEEAIVCWNTREPPTCLKCNEKHWLTRCKWFTEATADQRKAFIEKHKLCFNCFSTEHSARDCPSKRTCKEPGCGKRHHKLLHGARRAENRANLLREQDQTLPSSDSEEEETQERAYELVTQYGISLRVIPIVLFNPDTRKTKTYNALLDDGSQSTMISEKIFTELGLSGTSSPYRLQGVANQAQTYPSFKTRVGIRESDISKERIVNIRTLPDPVGDLIPTDWNVWKEHWPHLKDINFPTIDNDKVDMLIGGDQADLIAGHDVLGGLFEPVARLSPLGWTVLGRVSPTEHKQHCELVYKQLEDIRKASTPPFTGSKAEAAIVMRATTPRAIKKEAWDLELTELIQKQWEIDRTNEDDQTTLSRDEKRALDQLKQSIKLKDGRCEARCLWKVGEPALPNNLTYTTSRFLSWERSKIMKNPVWKEEYMKVIDSWIEKEYVRKVPEEERKPMTAYYLPTFGVLRPDKDTTKLRVVVDAKAKFNNKSLNDAILSGPNLINDLVTVLLRFRHLPIAVQADITEMFLQISLDPEDRKYHRFLHRRNPNEPIDEYEFQVHAFGNAGSPTVAIHTIREEAIRMLKFFPRACETILESTLVDDNLDSYHTVEEAIEAIKQLKEIYGNLRMALRKFASNHPDVISTVPAKDRAKSYTLDVLGNLTTSALKALGVSWNVEEDFMTFENLELASDKCTKRTILKAYAKLFDPLGFVLPFVMQARVLFQDCWKDKLDWDDIVPKDREEMWDSWLESLKGITRVSIPRCLKPNSLEISKSELHVFADASHKSYAAVAYVRNEYPEGHVEVRFAYAKGKVSPIKKITIPRLELLGAVLATDIAKTIWKATGLTLKRTYFWSDNMNVLWWIKQNPPEFAGVRGESDPKDPGPHQD